MLFSSVIGDMTPKIINNGKNIKNSTVLPCINIKFVGNESTIV